MRWKLVAMVLLLGASSTDPPPAARQHASLPWLHGLSNLVVADASMPSLEPVDPVDEVCGAGAFSVLQLIADVAPAPGNEILQTSLAGGVIVRDRDRNVVATAPGDGC